MWESMRLCHVMHSMKRIKILLNHIKDKNKFKNIDSLFPLIQCFKTTFNLLNFLFNFLRLLFVLFGSTFQDFLSLSLTSNSFRFHSPFSLLLIYIYISTTLHAIPSNTLRQKTMSLNFSLSMKPT